MQVGKHGKAGNHTDIIYSVNNYWVPTAYETQG